MELRRKGSTRGGAATAPETDLGGRDAITEELCVGDFPHKALVARLQVPGRCSGAEVRVDVTVPGFRGRGTSRSKAADAKHGEPLHEAITDFAFNRIEFVRVEGWVPGRDAST